MLKEKNKTFYKQRTPLFQSNQPHPSSDSSYREWAPSQSTITHEPHLSSSPLHTYNPPQPQPLLYPWLSTPSSFTTFPLKSYKPALPTTVSRISSRIPGETIRQGHSPNPSLLEPSGSSRTLRTRWRNIGPCEDHDLLVTLLNRAMATHTHTDRLTQAGRPSIPVRMHAYMFSMQDSDGRKAGQRLNERNQVI